MIRLMPMTDSEFDMYCSRTIAEYAEEHVRSGRWTAEEAPEKAKREYQELLPQGVSTPGHFLYTLQDTGTHEAVGILWFGIESEDSQQIAFIYDVFINPAFRRKGYATQAFRMLEDEVRARGVQQLRLHVFGHNHEARALYEKLGYVITNLSMAKSLLP